MILQRARRLRAPIQEWGCYKFDLLYAVVKYTNRAFTQEQINELYTQFERNGWMDEECTILAPDSITRHFGLRTQIVIEGGTHKLPPDRPTESGTFEVQRWIYRNMSHFVFYDPADTTRYDPWGVSQCLSRGTMADKRVFRRLEA